MSQKFRVDQHIDELYRCRDDYGGRSFEEYVRWLANHYASDTRIPPKIGVHCKNCEFRCTQTQRDKGFRDGFRECWSHQLKWTETDFERPTIFDLYDFRRTSELIDAGRIALDDLTEEDIGTDTDNEPGLHPKKMQCVRLEFLKGDRDGFFFDADGFREVMRNWQFPFHFIDFETAAPPVPLHRRLRPFQSLAFQFSHHVLHEDGKIEHAGQYLNTGYGVYPNFDFLRNLMASLEGHPGTIFRYASHENTILNHIVEQLDELGQEEIDYEQLRRFACSISRPTQAQPNPWAPGDREMVDLRKLVARHYYHPRMKGSQSIKYVLPAVLTGSEFLRRKYSVPRYGYADEPGSSKNFASQTWIQFDGTDVIDPYQLLPPVLDEVDKGLWDEMWTDEEIRGGGAAMAAYLRLQQRNLPAEYRNKVNCGLLRYCELDTLAMLMIVESWLNHS